VNAVHVLGSGLRVFHLVFFGKSGVGMAGGAGVGEVQLENGGIGVLGGQDIVRTVAIGASGSAGSAEGMTDAMDAGGILFPRLLMTTSAIDGFGSEIVVGVLGRDVRMTSGTGVGCMDRCCKYRIINK